MQYGESLNGARPAASSVPAGIAHDAIRAWGPRRGGSSIAAKRSASAAMALFLGMMALGLGGCVLNSNNMAPPPVSEPQPRQMDTLLVSDLLRFYLDGDMEFRRGYADCYGGGCIQTDGSQLVDKLPEYFVFAGHHDHALPPLEHTITNRNGIMVGDVSQGTKDLPDLPGFASQITVTGWGGWGEYLGFHTLYHGFVRFDRSQGRERPQRVIEASVGGYSSEGNPNPASGPLTWTGGVAAIDYSVVTNSENRILAGDSKLTVYLNERVTETLGRRYGVDRDEYLISLDITDLADIASGKTYDDLSWRDIPLRDGGFETFETKGRFFGPDHEEVGGTFERNKIIGAFGASREEEPDSS